VVGIAAAVRTRRCGPGQGVDVVEVNLIKLLSQYRSSNRGGVLAASVLICNANFRAARSERLIDRERFAVDNELWILA
jgi:hypothetical protein